MARKKQAKQPKPRKHVPRQTRRFQLRVNHPLDHHVGEILDYKRSQRAEVTAIRDGVRLLWALENNDLEVLFELFPNLRARFTTGGGEGSELAKEIAAQIILQGGTPGYLMQSAQPSPAPAMPTVTGNLKALGSKAAPDLPRFDEDLDDLPTITTTKSDDKSAGLNFLNSLQFVT